MIGPRPLLPLFTSGSKTLCFRGSTARDPNSRRSPAMALSTGEVDGMVLRSDPQPQRAGSAVGGAREAQALDPGTAALVVLEHGAAGTARPCRRSRTRSVFDDPADLTSSRLPSTRTAGGSQSGAFTRSITARVMAVEDPRRKVPERCPPWPSSRAPGPQPAVADGEQRLEGVRPGPDRSPIRSTKPIRSNQAHLQVGITADSLHGARGRKSRRGFAGRSPRRTGKRPARRPYSAARPWRSRIPPLPRNPGL